MMSSSLPRPVAEVRRGWGGGRGVVLCSCWRRRQPCPSQGRRPPGWRERPPVGGEG